MTAEIINLRQARKLRARNAAEAQATENRIRFGRTRGEREQDEQSAAKALRRIEGHRREPGVDGPDESPSDGSAEPPGSKSP
jgi:hypothetical protein